MSLSDFWDNITTPGFLQNAVEDLKIICDETKEEFREIYEDGQELVTDAFRHTVIENNGEYQFTSEQRQEATAKAQDATKALFNARGVTSESNYLFNFVDIYIKSLLDDLESVSFEQIEGARKNPLTRTAPLPLVKIKDLKRMRHALLELVQSEEEPTYQRPDDKPIQISSDGPPSHMPDRHERKKATELYLDRLQTFIDATHAAIARQEDQGAPFCLKRLSKSQQQQLQRLCESLMLFQIKTIAPYTSLKFAIASMAHAQKTPEDQTEQHLQNALIVMERLTCIYHLVVKAYPLMITDQIGLNAEQEKVIENITANSPELETEDSSCLE